MLQNHSRDLSGLAVSPQQKISHLDLKPENIMLDVDMEAKITDFGLSRFLDQGQSKIFTQHICGTLRYIAPEVIDKRELSLKSDIYALGIIIIELLTGISMISLENWDESLDLLNCPGAEMCNQIAHNCTDTNKDNRPTIHEVIRDLDSIIPKSFTNQVTSTVFPGTELLDVYPGELRFLFVPNGVEMSCHLSITNKTDGEVYSAITPKDLDIYEDGNEYCLLPMSTTVVTVRMKAVKELPLDMVEWEIVMFTTCRDAQAISEHMPTSSDDEDMPVEDVMKELQELFGGDLHRAVLKALVIFVHDDLMEAHTTLGRENKYIRNNGMDVHPTWPWIVVVTHHMVYIWNWQTNEEVGHYKSHMGRVRYSVAKFIAQEQWVVIGDSDGSILVHTCPTMDLVKEFNAHGDCVSLLAVHPTRPFLLSCCNSPLSLKLWDWNRDWSCTRIFDVRSPLREVMFNPKHISTFATHEDGGVIKTWRIGHPSPVAKMHKLDGKPLWPINCFTYSGDQHFIATILGKTTYILDLQKEECVHTLYSSETEDRIYTNHHISASGESIFVVACHPTRPVLVTASQNGSIRVLDSTTYRLKKAYDNLGKNPIHVGFTGSSRLVIGYRNGTISVIDMDLE
ncbi:hypothetical protein CFC21_090551 [Triticum aestivum]|uniref:Protein kinase domain-containing protein n=2 Tax=Triticum aestivum TaxID=4565 RepID=A0A9R1LEF6_WHEAT|nr:hypothetical protein CFC21_090551 [Triticum aestivum]